MSKPKAQINRKAIENVKKLLSENNMRQNQLAEKAELSNKTISDVLCGHVGMTENVAKQIGKAFSVQPEWILAKEGFTRVSQSASDRVANSIDRDMIILKLILKHGYTLFLEVNGQYEEYDGESLKFYETIHHTTGEQFLIKCPDAKRVKLTFEKLIQIIKDIDTYSVFAVSRQLTTMEA